MQRSFKQINQPGVFSITQWNTLADSLADNFPLCNNVFLSWDYRSILHKQHITQRAYADIICLEEVDHPEHFESFLSQSHQILFHKKPDGQDGQLVAVCNNKFEIVEKEAVQYVIDEGKKTCNQSFWYILLKDKQVNKNVIIIVTHLKAKKEFEEIRVQQVNHILKYLQSKKEHENIKYVPVVLVGDFNTEPTFKSIQQINDCGLFKNAYEDMHLDFTTYKVREHNDVQCRVIDYIFYTPEQLNLISNKGLPTKEEIGDRGLPCEVFSSDHLSLTATFSFK